MSHPVTRRTRVRPRRQWPPGWRDGLPIFTSALKIYLFTQGSGRMHLGQEERPVRAGDCVVIPPGVSHKLWADPDETLILLCCCAPAYSHADTLLLEN